MTNTLDTQPYEPALQVALRPIHEKAPCRKKLIDGSTCLLLLQKRLLGALNGIPCLLVPLHQPAIHNYQLYIILPDSVRFSGFTMIHRISQFSRCLIHKLYVQALTTCLYREMILYPCTNKICPTANAEQTEQWCQTSEANRQQPERCLYSNLALATLNSALLQSCPNVCSRWVEKEKMTIFSLFNLKKKRPWIAQDVNRGFLALALRKSGIDILSNPWYPLTTPLALSARRCTQLAGTVNGAEQVTRTVPVASLVLLSLFAVLNRSFSSSLLLGSLPAGTLPNENEVSL